MKETGQQGTVFVQKKFNPILYYENNVVMQHTHKKRLNTQGLA